MVNTHLGVIIYLPGTYTCGGTVYLIMYAVRKLNFKIRYKNLIMLYQSWGVHSSDPSLGTGPLTANTERCRKKKKRKAIYQAAVKSTLFGQPTIDCISAAHRC